MQYIKKHMVAVLIVVGIQFSACQKHSDAHHTEYPAKVEHIEGSEISRVTLTAKAMERLGVQTTQVIEVSADRFTSTAARMARLGSMRKEVPYSAIIYDPHGYTWVYTSPKPRTFVRHKVEVDFIEGDRVILKNGPPTGTIVASVAVAELYGTEFEVGH